MRKIPISGGPHSGKTTIHEALRGEYPDAYFVAEPATIVIERELERQTQDPGYRPIVPWDDYSRFGPVVADESETLEAEIPDDTRLSFQDRSLIDTIGYCRLNHFDKFIPEVERRIAAANYAFAFFCEPVGVYTANEVRRETSEEARRTHEHLAQAYDQSGIRVVHLPAVSVEERLIIIRNTVESLN